MMSHKNRCRICNSSNLFKFLELGDLPLPNAFLREDQLTKAEPRYPLNVGFCQECGLVQLMDVVPKEEMFSEYLYYSSASRSISKHFAEQAKEVAERFPGFVVEIGSNDGTLLRALKQNDVIAVGVEPAKNIAKLANDVGLQTINDFFSKDLARRIADESGHASAIIANNVVAHIDNSHELVESVETLLAPDGVFIFEVPYLVDLVSKLEYDTIYHEHLSYFAMRPLMELFEMHDMKIFDVKRLGVHGGSIRVYVRRNNSGSVSGQIAELLMLERRLKLDSPETYSKFTARIETNKIFLQTLLKLLKDLGKRTVGYAAPAKGNVLLNYCDIDTNILPYTVDTTPAKQGLYTPGTHIPIYPPQKFRDEQPDYALMLAWNYEQEILAQEHAYHQKGGKFIIPIPYPRIV